MKCKVNVVELSNELEKERGDIFFPASSRLRRGKVFSRETEGRDEKVGGGNNSSSRLFHRFFSPCSDSNCVTIARNFFCVLLWKRVRLIVDGDYKNLGGRKF